MLTDQQIQSLKPGDIVCLKKPHPCGSYQWRIERLGADIALTCCQCGRFVVLARHDCQRRIKSIVDRA